VRAYLPEPGRVEDWTRFVPAEWRALLEVSPAPRPQSGTLRFIVVDEEVPAAAWSALYEQTEHAYRSWWLNGHGRRPDRQTAERALSVHMPELVSMHRRLVQLTGDDDTMAAMLTLWDPPPFIVACSQAVAHDRATGEPVLLRNYDYDPGLFEATVYRSRWNGGRVLGTGDCLWGLVDGVNDRGLAASLTFGGRQVVGSGFGIPLVMRYVLEVADDVSTAVEVLGRLPHQLSYNITLCDAADRVATVYIAPDRPILVTDHRATTNHPPTVEWPEHSAWVCSVERLELLNELHGAEVDDRGLLAAMLSQPLLARRWDQGFATLFTAAYRPTSGRLDYHWPNRHTPLSIDDALPDHFDVTFDDRPESVASDADA
jgi:predicted choloylglycine hydrolase